MGVLPIAVWELKPYWVPELQRQLEPLGARVSTCRMAADVPRRIADGARQLVIALTGGERLPLTSVERWAASGLRVHVVLAPEAETYRWFLHELGATSVFDFAAARASLARAVSKDGHTDPSVRSASANHSGRHRTVSTGFPMRPAG